jgi:hypothetical protein
MSSYALFLRDEEMSTQAYTPEELQAYFQRFVDWAEKLQREGRLRGVERLEGTEGKTVRKRGGSVVVDGPYVEGKEAVLGFFIVEAADYAEAARIAEQCPCVAVGGSVEVRQVGEFPKPQGLP